MNKNIKSIKSVARERQMNVLTVSPPGPVGPEVTLHSGGPEVGGD